MPSDLSGLERGTVQSANSAAELIQLSWAENRENPLQYSPELIRSLSGIQGEQPVLMPAFYDNGKLVAFVAGFPRTFLLYGQKRSLLLMTFFTVHPERKGKGLGKAIWAECVRQAKECGYDGTLHYCAEGNPSNGITAAGAREAGFEAKHIFTVRYWMRLLRPGLAGISAQPVNTDVFLRAAEALSPDIALQRVWSKAEAAWLCNRPDGTVVTDNTGALSGYKICVADKDLTPCFFVEDILWGHSTNEERAELLQRFLAEAAQNASLAIVPVLGYSDLSPFQAAGFRRSPRLLHTYLTMWSPLPDEGDLSCIYTDVL